MPGWNASCAGDPCASSRTSSQPTLRKPRDALTFPPVLASLFSGYLITEGSSAAEGDQAG
jgi:hypothetical protein